MISGESPVFHQQNAAMEMRVYNNTTTLNPLAVFEYHAPPGDPNPRTLFSQYDYKQTNVVL